MKRGVIVVLVMLLVLLSTSVAALLSVDLSPASAYETNSVGFELNVSNFRNAYEINSLSVDASGFSVSSLVDYVGWTESYNSSVASWTDGSIANNVVLAVFEFLAEAPMVSEDQAGEATVTLVDSFSVPHSFTFPLTILNDDTPPVMTDVVPVDGAYVKEGIPDYAVSANITDPETGIENATFHWVRCNYDENITPTDHTLQLAQNQGVYQTTIDLSGYTDTNQVCFDFTAYNRGGDQSSQTGTLTIDGVPPEVTLVSPVDRAIIGLSRNFSFFAADNTEETVTCSMYVDGIEYIQDIEAQHMDIVSIGSADVVEGEHTWSIACRDPAGWEAASATWTYTLDKTPPSIEMTAPENNTIIAETETLLFSVTDNFSLYKVWLMVGGNETEVDGEFTIDVHTWPDGPNEFAVRASDSVGNQAERTYRILIDRTAPQIALVAPETNSTSDVHVAITYRVLDDYDEEMDCRVYVDEEGQEQHVAQDEAETVWPTLMAIGEHRWNVQCVDDAGNTGTSDERQLTVVDISGPDIAMDSVDTVTRGDPVEISLEVIDVSGVDAVTAELIEPDGHHQTISLEKLGDTYTAAVETTIESDVGTYTLQVYAVDTLNFSNQEEFTFDVTYRYVVALELDSSDVAPGTDVIASGVVVYDNGSVVPEDVVVLSLPGNVSEDVVLGDDGAFSHTFSAPETDGAYDIVVSIVSVGNGMEFTSTEQLTVATPEQPQVRGGGGGHGGGSGSSGVADTDSSGGCEADWSCTAWTECSSGQQKKICVDLNHCNSDDVKQIKERSCRMPEKTEETENDGSRERVAVSAAREPLPDPEEHTVDTIEEDQGTTAGIGKATGFMSRFDIRPMNIIFALLLMTVLVGTLYRYGWGKGDRRRKPAAVDMLGGRKKLNLEDYLEGRARRRI
ncbi:hypothetical protein ACFL3V_00105 [Nanoarchaeota archaeon]